MSVLDFPRIHFSGACMLHEPTGSSNAMGNLDLTQNRIYDEKGLEIPLELPPLDFYKYFSTQADRYGADGLPDENGPFNRMAGRDYEGNSRVLWQVKVSGCQLNRQLCTDDPVVGHDVMLWGDYNEYLGTTFNQPKVAELDPSSRWTRQIFGGHLTIGRMGRSHTYGNVFNGRANEVHHARWHKQQHYTHLPPHWNNDEIGRADLFQMAIPSAQILAWHNHIQSPCIQAFIEGMYEEAVTGVVIQFSLLNASNPQVPNAPTHYSLYGTMGLWKADTEMATYPAGRILMPVRTGNPMAQAAHLGAMSLQISETGVSLNALLAFPFSGRSETYAAGPLHDPGKPVLEQDLVLMSKADHRPLALIPCLETTAPDFFNKSGIIDVSWLPQATQHNIAAAEEYGLYLAIAGANGMFQPVFEEKEWIIQSDDANVYLEMPSHEHGLYFDKTLHIRSFLRGKPAALGHIEMVFVHNPANHPFGLPGFSLKNLQKASLLIHSEADSFLQERCVFSTDQAGRAVITLRGGAPGAGRLVFLTNEQERAAFREKSARDDFDFFDEKGTFWSDYNLLHVKVLPDDWYLYNLPQSEVDYPLMYKEVLQFYELLYPFMNKEVFSLGNKAKTETYSLLSWQMVDPLNRDKSTYMPPTRELSYPKALLFKSFLMNTARLGCLPKAVCPMKINR